MNCTFSPNNYKNKPSLNLVNNPAQVAQPGKNYLHGEKSFNLSEVSSTFR